MAKFHYIIDARKKMRIEKNVQNKISVNIENIVRLEENHIIKIDDSVLVDDYKKGGKKKKPFEIIAFILYFIAIMLLVILLILLGFGKDFNIFSSYYIDNIIGITALLFSIASISKVKECLSKIFGGTGVYNKMWHILMLLCLPFYITLAIREIGLSSSIGNICGVIGIFISICTW